MGEGGSSGFAGFGDVGGMTGRTVFFSLSLEKKDLQGIFSARCGVSDDHGEVLLFSGHVLKEGNEMVR